MPFAPTRHPYPTGSTRIHLKRRPCSGRARAGRAVTAGAALAHELLYLDQARFARAGPAGAGGIRFLIPICGNLPGAGCP